MFDLSMGMGFQKRALSRYFTALDAAYNHYFYIPALPFVDGSKISIDFYPVQSTGNALLGGTDADAAHGIRLYISGGALALKIADGIGVYKYIIANMPALELNKLSTATISRSGSVVSLQLNDNTPVTLDPANGWLDSYFEFVGCVNGVSNFVSGILANLLAKLGTVVTRDYKVDEDFSQTLELFDYSGNEQHGTAVNIVASKQYTFAGNWWRSENLVVNGGFDSATGWTLSSGITIDAGELVFTSVADTLRAYSPIQTLPGATIDVDVVVSEYSAGAVRVRFPFVSSNIVAAGNYRFTGIADSSGEISMQAQGSTTLKIDDIAVYMTLEIA